MSELTPPSDWNPEDVWAVGAFTLIVVGVLYVGVRVLIDYTETLAMLTALAVGGTVGLYALGYVLVLAYGRVVAWHKRGENA